MRKICFCLFIGLTGFCYSQVYVESVGIQTDNTDSNQHDPLLVIDLNDKRNPISATQYGVFFEEINHAGDGGLYAELIRNRSFEESLDDIPGWSLYITGPARGSISLETENLLNNVQSQAMKIDMTPNERGRVSIVNEGYWGIAIRENRLYDLSFYAKSGLDKEASITAKLQNNDGTISYAEHSFVDLSPCWKKYSVRLLAGDTDPDGRLSLEISSNQSGIIWFDMVSLFPPTWKNRSNGLRPDIARMIADLNPKFIRFPGGAYTSTWPEKAPEWLKEMGPVEEREPHPGPGEKNVWGYHNSGGFGYHEYLLFAEDLGAEPIYIFQGGAHSRSEELGKTAYFEDDKLNQLIEDIINGIEYANGDLKTIWGKRRGVNGHPEPFNMKYIGIGNENIGAPFHENYIKIYSAIKKKYPELQIIWGGVADKPADGNPVHGYRFDGIMPYGSSAEIIDEHIYDTEELIHNFDRYNSQNYPRGVEREADIFIGEISANQDDLNAALIEAAFLISTEKHSDKVIMACYAPLLCNVNFKNWDANAIYFDSHRVFGTPSYYAQHMLSHHSGDVNIGFSGLHGILNKFLFLNVTQVDTTGEVILKIVNKEGMTYPVEIDIQGTCEEAYSLKEIVMNAKHPNACNSFDNPKNVSPVTYDSAPVRSKFTYTVLPYSFTVLRLTPVK